MIGEETRRMTLAEGYRHEFTVQATQYVSGSYPLSHRIANAVQPQMASIPPHDVRNGAELLVGRSIEYAADAYASARLREELPTDELPNLYFEHMHKLLGLRRLSDSRDARDLRQLTREVRNWLPQNRSTLAELLSDCMRKIGTNDSVDWLDLR